MSRHGVTDEDVRREAEQDDDNYENVKEGGCCLLEAIAVSSIGSLAVLFLCL